MKRKTIIERFNIGDKVRILPTIYSTEFAPGTYVRLVYRIYGYSSTSYGRFVAENLDNTVHGEVIGYQLWKNPISKLKFL